MKHPDQFTDERIYSAHSDVTPIAPISMLNTIAEEDYEKNDFACKSSGMTVQH